MFEIIFYMDSVGGQPVREYIQELKAKAKKIKMLGYAMKK